MITGGAPLLFAAFSAPFWLAGGRMTTQLAGDVAVTTRLRLSRGDGWSLTREVGGKVVARTDGLLSGVQMRCETGAASPDSAAARSELEPSRLELVEKGGRAHVLAMLGAVEALWLCIHANDFLQGGSFQLED